MTLRRNKIDLLSPFQPKQKTIVTSYLMSENSQLQGESELRRSGNVPLRPAALPGKSLDDGAFKSIQRKKTEVQETSPKVNNIQPPPKKEDLLAKVDKLEKKHYKMKKSHRGRKSRIYDDPEVVAGYTEVPLLDAVTLPRGGLSIETQAVGRIQFGIPPETIKDSMRLGLSIPEIYVVPVERFCREMGPALGINLAEFEFPAYFNYFVRGRKVTLVVDSDVAESSIRGVFGETLLGPQEFRIHEAPKGHEDEDFDPTFPEDDRPNFFNEFYHFRTAEKSTNFSELSIDTLIGFVHFQGNQEEREKRNLENIRLGKPPNKAEKSRKTSIDDLTMDRKRSGSSRNLSNHLGQTKENSFHADDNFGDDSTAMSDPETSQRQQSFTDTDINQLSTVDPVDAFNMSSSRFAVQRRPSNESSSSLVSAGSFGGNSWADSAASYNGDDSMPRANWMFSQVKWLGEVATVYPPDATPEQRKNNTTKRVEIFKMPGGTEYVIHDVDENNIIIGKARFSGTVRVPDEIAVEGFLAPDAVDSEQPSFLNMNSPAPETSMGIDLTIPKAVIPPTFHPPSFGVTVLGNSHGFDKNGSTSGYVLWINGRGIMIDPPPYSSSTLEREGIRPQMIVAIIITHCHADHDAGAFQKVLTGSRVAMITTPTIYRSFIRKYAALSGLSPALLRHSHRHRPAVVGQPLKFQGAKFHFLYTLHTIPCIAFKVEWRGRSMVFTGDHLNSPPLLKKLEDSGVLSRGRADSLRRIPLQDCDVLLHEAGAPPIHTPISVLQELPERVKERLYIVHTSALPPDCGLRVAPTGTAGTIRLDKRFRSGPDLGIGGPSALGGGGAINPYQPPPKFFPARGEGPLDPASLDDGGYPNLSILGDGGLPAFSGLSGMYYGSFRENKMPPLVFLRPTCVSDAWFILNLLSAVPFFSSLSYVNTMEVLEIANVELFCADEIVVPANKRMERLCVVWEGTLVEREASNTNLFEDMVFSGDENSIKNGREQEDSSVSSVESPPSAHASSRELKNYSLTVWHAGDWTGPVALQPDIERSADKQQSIETPRDIVAVSQEGVKVITLLMKDLNKILKRGSKLFRKYLAVREKHESDENVIKAKVSANEGTYDELERTAGLRGDNLLEVLKFNSALGKLSAFQKRHLESIAEGPRFFDEGSYMWQVGENVDFAFLIVTGTAIFGHKDTNDDLHFGSNSMRRDSISSAQVSRRGSADFSLDGARRVDEYKLLNVPPNSEYSRLEVALQHRVEKMDNDIYDHPRDMLPREEVAQNARDRFGNKVLARLYARRAYTMGLVFSRGHFISDISRMVSGDLAYVQEEKRDRGHCHSSNMLAGQNGCVAYVFQRSSLVPFLEGNPGVLLMLLGTHAVV